MEVRKEQILNKYKMLLPINSDKESFNKTMNYIADKNIKGNTLILGSSNNFKMPFMSMLFNHLKYVDRAPTLEVINAYQLVEMYFGDNGERLPIGTSKKEVSCYTIGFNEPPNKKTLEFLSYLMYQGRGTTWIYLKGENRELVKIAEELNYTILDLDNLGIKQHTMKNAGAKTSSKKNNQAYDVF